MNKISNYLKGIAAIFMLCFVLSACSKQEEEVKAGQIWVQEYDAGNPFEQLPNDTIYILDVRKDYCQYKA